MEFLKERCYTALNADELKAGDKVIVAETLMSLRENVENNAPVRTIKEILGEDFAERFNVDIDWNSHLAYLVERKANCCNCGMKSECKDADIENPELHNCLMWEKPKTEQKAEKHYRPFKDTDELIKVWCDKGGKWQKRELTMPHIWVRCKASGNSYLITGYFTNDNEVCFSATGFSMNDLLKDYEFLDGSPCGVEE